MFSAADLRNPLISLSNYEVATSPIYVFLIGTLHTLSGTYFSIALHTLYVLFALGSIVIFAKILNPSNWRTFSPIMILFAGSGYFVAPSIWPTSDTPATYFFLICLYSLLKKDELLLGISAFLLISTRQNFAWLSFALSTFVFFTCERNWKKYSKLALIFAPSFLSLIVTFFFFDGHLTPPLYEAGNLSNVFIKPNFLTSVQIGLCLFAILLPFKLQKIWKHRLEYVSYKYLVFTIIFSSFPIIYIFYGKGQSIEDGLGWISILVFRLNLNILFVAALASFGILLLFMLCATLDQKDKKLLTTIFISLLVFSLVMPVPFLRYFEVSLIIICSLILGKRIKGSEELGKIGSIWLSVFVSLVNFSKIIG